MATTSSSLLPLEPWQDLSGKVVMVTGASSGIGLEFCLSLSKAGCKIIAAARRIDRLQSLCNEINGMDDRSSSQVAELRAVPVLLDISADGISIEASVQSAWEAFGRIDALINNAGVRGRLHTPLDLSEQEWNSIFRTNLTGSWLVSKFVCRRMREANLRGSVINISSVDGLNRGKSQGGLAYSASKGGIDTMTKIMAMELGPNKIRVNSISPGIFKSVITEGLMKKDWLNNVIMRVAPLKTLGTANPALTSLASYLIHDSSEYISGNVFIVEAGTTLPGIPIFSSL